MHDHQMLDAPLIALRAGPPSPDGKAGILERSFALLEAVVASPMPPKAGDLVEKLDLPRATVYRIIEWFLSEGFLVRDPACKRLVIGHRLSGLAFHALRTAKAVAQRRTLLAALAHETGGTCDIGIIDRNRVIYLDRVESATWPPEARLMVNSRAPLHATAIGKLFLALSLPHQCRALLAAVKLRSFTPATIINYSRLKQELESIRRQGFAIDNQEFLAGTVAIAVPITDRRGEIRAGLAVHAPEPRMTVADAKQHLPRLRKAAEQLRAFAGDFFDIPDRSPALTARRSGDQLAGKPDRAHQVEAESEARENLEAVLER